ncbi:hypothetical protein CLHOM_01370 [Clostridium homopropionicum DSM 5847]|uniref:Uncharacterized protein n=1 Tax=Clostridium homopropionicum DSM 5847 TaxID=1121318 RepID=A0A0L6ZER6_9CLOT|nr:hypothetical protein [Clostridium homopropionicum]KOA21466.1 hypothetical protein CLHOM_01370 [Clostridium homopropionicum DSM 5847]SFG08815.1 hypothetical protein SAMN04488501_10587 [Clostridium homopropionicum]
MENKKYVQEKIRIYNEMEEKANGTMKFNNKILLDIISCRLCIN